MMKKAIIVFFLFFFGMSGFMTVDRVCRDQTGLGGSAGIFINRTEEGKAELTFFGLKAAAGLSEKGGPGDLE